MSDNSQQSNKSVFSGSFSRTLSWYEQAFVPLIESAVGEFWDFDVECRLFGVFDNGVNIFKGEEFFVTKVPSPSLLSEDAKDYILVKLSKELCKTCLEKALGKNDFSNFQFDRLTELEFKVLSQFNAAIGKGIYGLAGEDDYSLSEECYELLFYLRTNDETLGKIVLSIPCGLLNPQESEIKEFEFDVNSFANTATTVSITVGKSKTFLSELRGLEKDDVVVLEDSRLNKMTLHINGETTEIKVNPDPSLIFNTNGNEEQIMNGKLSKDMWDTIQVEIGAEFEKIKISLGELRQISEGLVVDIGSVYKNKISLKVENKTIANGELVIINDRYGIRIDEVFKQPKAEIPEEPAAKSVLDDIDDFEEQEIINEEINDEDIDENDIETEDINENEDEYSDFDVDDENL